MPESHDAPEIDLHVGPVRLYVHSVFVAPQRFPPRWQWRTGPLIERGQTFEAEDPYRDASSIVVRIPFTRRGFVFGYWNLPTGLTQPAFIEEGHSSVTTIGKLYTVFGTSGDDYEEGTVEVSVIPWQGDSPA